MDSTDQLLTVSEVAAELRLSEATIRRSIRSGELEVYRVGAQPQIRVCRTHIDAFLRRKAPKVSGSAAVHMGSTPEPLPSSPVVSKSGRSADGRNWTVVQADAVQGLRSLKEGSVNCIVTSPPYYWQRDYEVQGQYGHEASIEGYVSNMLRTFAEAKRVLRDDGVLFLNIGDTYYSAKGKPHGADSKHRARQLSRRTLRAVDGPGLNVPRKSLIGIPWRVALALQEDGWVLRSAIIWQRPAPMPEPTAHDRPWRSHEPIFLFAKQPRYWFNRASLEGDEDIWNISARPNNPASHSAPYPRELADRCVRAGCPEGGTVLDPFVGSGTTIFSALENGANAVGIDIKKEYCDFIARRLAQNLKSIA